jgi:hypothetical protein
MKTSGILSYLEVLELHTILLFSAETPLFSLFGGASLALLLSLLFILQ